MPALTLSLVCAAALGTPELRATRVEEAPSVDGRLDEAVWALAGPVPCLFTQYDPENGAPMSVETVISILYDDEAVYFGFELSDPDPAGMMEALCPRDDYATGEWIAVLLDTWGDGREASSFEVSLANSQLDSRISPFGNWDYSWDAVWKSGTCRTDSGWSAEIAIPFSCLRFSGSEGEQPWTVNFQRIRGATRENGWFVLSDTQQMARLETFAPIRGMSGVDRSLGIEFRPYGSARLLRTAEADSWNSDPDAGLDVKIGISSGVALDLTVLPDFGQVEADEAEMNLSHFELFLDERRPFFMESEDIFEMPFHMFYSRRIGAAAPNGEVTPIAGGFKLSGNLGGGYRFGLLDAVTSSVSEDSVTIEPAANYSILRAMRESGSYDYVGVAAVDRYSWAQDGIPAAESRAFAVDGSILIPGNHLLHGEVAGSSGTGLESDGAYEISMSRVRSTFTYDGGFSYVGEDFDVNATGFTTQTGYWDGWASAYRSLAPGGFISRAGYGLSAYYAELDSGEITSRNISADADASLPSGANFGGGAGLDGRTFDRYEGPSGRWYDGTASVYAYAGTGRFHGMSLSADAGTGGYCNGGSYVDCGLHYSIRPSEPLVLSLEGDWYRTEGADRYNWEAEEWDVRDTDWRSLVFRAGYMFGPDMDVRLFSQLSEFESDFALTGETESGELAANMLFSWRYRPGSMLYLLGENRFEKEADGGFGSPDLGLYAKLTWFLPV